jgi:predicted HTH transcriptional regulator
LPIDEFKGVWRALVSLAPERLLALRRVVTIESVASSTRIEGSKLTNAEVDALLSNIKLKKFTTAQAEQQTGANRATIKVHLAKLVKAGHLVKHGVGRGTWYEAAGR